MTLLASWPMLYLANVFHIIHYLDRPRKNKDHAMLAGKAIVRVLMTKNAQEFITPLTLQTLSGNPVATETFSLTQESEIGHIRLADTANLLLVAPATANVIAKLAHGLADDLLTTVVLATTAPVLVAPAMNVHMY